MGKDVMAAGGPTETPAGGAEAEAETPQEEEEERKG